MGAISFVNTVPIYANYQPTENIDLIYDVPAQLNARILAKELNISPVSSACYLRNKAQFILLDDLSVSSPGAVESVIFISKKPLGADMLDFAAISVPNDSETSIALLRYLLKEATGENLEAYFTTYEANNYRQTLLTSGNALIIGDNALMIQNEGIPEGFHCYDLSTLWKDRTGLPFVFAVWVADRRWAEENPEALQAINHALIQTRNEFFDRPEAFQRGLHRAQSRSGLPMETLTRYYTYCLNYTLGADHQTALELFDVILHAADREPVAHERSSVAR